MYIPDSNIGTLLELMQPDSVEKFHPYFKKLEGRARDFFETEFAGREFTNTKSEILRRLWTALENQTFDRMFSNPHSKFDMFEEMNAGKVILISTAKDLLKERGARTLGRFYLGLIYQAAIERAAIPPEQRMPTYVYIDEAADYINETIALILAQARKYKIGLILAHQYMGQLDPKLKQAIAANTSIKMVGGVSSGDATAMSSEMGVSASYIKSMRKGHFAVHARGATPHALEYSVEFGRMERMARMSDLQRQKMQQHMREQYSVHISELLPPNIDDIDDDSNPSDDDDPTKPSQSW